MGTKTHKCSQDISVWFYFWLSHIKVKGGRNLSTVIYHKRLGYFHAIIVNCSFTTSYLFLNYFFWRGKLMTYLREMMKVQGQDILGPHLISTP